MNSRHNYCRGFGFHVDSHKADCFSSKYLDENGRVDMSSVDLKEFEEDLNDFLSGFYLVESGVITDSTLNNHLKCKDAEVV